MNDLKKNIPFMRWIIEVAEEKIVEDRLIKEKFNSHNEFIIFTIIWLRVYKHIFKIIKSENSNLKFDKYLKDFYYNQQHKYLGITINALTRESEIPRSTVKRIVENLISKNLVSRNLNRLIIPTSKVRDTMSKYRKYTLKTHKKLFDLFKELELSKKYSDKDNL